METTLDMPVIDDQRAFNLRRWKEVRAHPTLNAIEGRVETDRFGYAIVHPLPVLAHSRYQSEISFRIHEFLPGGKAIVICPISTSEGVKAVDVIWISKERLKNAVRGDILIKTPEICVEVLSPSNTRQEIAEKKRLYFEGGAEEVWICDLKGGLHFFGKDAPKDELTTSAVCPEFPKQLEV